MLQRICLVLLVLVAMVLLATTTPAFAQVGPFNGLTGLWVGTGKFHMENGKHESVSCRTTYFASESDTSLRVTFRCASPSDKFEAVGRMKSSGGTLSGSWSESRHGNHGSISGMAKKGQIHALVNGEILKGSIDVTHSSVSQSVTVVLQSLGKMTLSLWKN
ncbi:MAG: hypothetical protein WA021_02175 [Minisyncoccia bacterium]